MANPEHVKIVRQGAESIEKWRAENPGVRLDLSGASLSILDYHQAFMDDVDLTSVTLSDTDVSVDFLYGNTGVIQDLKNKVDSQLAQSKRSKKRVRFFFRFLNWSVSKLLGADLIKAGSEFKENVEAWQLDQRNYFPASEGIELTIAAFVRFVRVGFVSLLIALVPISFQIAQTILMNKQNVLINDQNNYFQEQNQLDRSQNAYSQEQSMKAQMQVEMQSEEIKRAYRNELIVILYQENDNKNSVIETAIGFMSKEKKRKTPKANLRLRQEAVLEFIKLEQDTGKRGKEIDLSNAFLSGLDLSQDKLKKVDLENSLQGANLRNAHLDGADLIDTHLKEVDLSEALLGGTKFFRTHLEQSYFLRAELEGAGFDGAHLEKAKFNGAHLDGATFFATNLEEGRFYGANLRGARFDRSILRGAKFDRANLQEASFINNHLEGATFRNANLEGLKVNSLHWIERLQKLDPPVRHFDYDYWSVAQRKNKSGRIIYVLVGPAEAKKPNLENQPIKQTK